MLTLRNVSQIDIKSIDLAHYVNTLTHRKDILVYIIVVIVSVFLNLKIFNYQTAQARGLQTKITALEDKVIAISEYEKAKKDVSAYFASLPTGFNKLDTLIEEINSLAITNNIQIFSFSPAGSDTTDFYRTTRVKLDIEAHSYEDIGFFVSDIESSEYNVRVEKISSSTPSPSTHRLQRGYRRQTEHRPDDKPETATFKAMLEIASIAFKK